MAINDENILEARNIRKSFSGVEVLHGVNFSLKKGEIHGLAGANGAGKSTLMKILNGVYRKDGGEILLKENPVHFTSPLEAADAGIAMVFQEFSLIPTMTVNQNIFLAREPLKRFMSIDHKESDRLTAQVLESLDIEVDPGEYVENLPVGTQQIVEIAKALSKESSVLILDEPTASLSNSEIEIFFTILRKLKEKGMSIIIITHHLQEILDICDRVTVLRDGNVELSERIESVTIDSIIKALVGHNVADQDFVTLSRSKAYDREADPCLEVKSLCYKNMVRDLSFQLRGGEVVGLAGLLGSGRTEVLKNIYGLLKPDSGEVVLKGEGVRFRHPAEAIGKGISFVPEHRHEHGIIKGQSVTDNIMLPVWKRYLKTLFISKQRAGEKTDELIRKLKIKTQAGSQLIEELSGGNQQKAVIGKAIVGNVEVLLLDEPTVGVDISSKQEILAVVRSLADEGKAVLMVSSEMDELVQVCDRILVIKDGSLIHEFNQHEDGTKLTEDILISASQGAVPA